MAYRRRRKRQVFTEQEDKIYLIGKVVETFPGTKFGVVVERKNNLAPLNIKASLKTLLIKKRVIIIKGDTVKVEVDIEEMAKEESLKGVIVQRIDPRRPPTNNK